MPKRKSSIKSKIVVKKNFLSLKNILASVVLATLLIGGYFYSTMQKSSINLIGDRGIGISTPSPTPSTPPLACETVSSFSLTGSCGKDSYQMVSFTCGTNKLLKRQGGVNSCKSYDSWYREAQSACKSTCPTPPPIQFSTKVTLPYMNKVRIYPGLFDGYIYLTVSRQNGEKITYTLKTYPNGSTDPIELPFQSNRQETLSISAYTGVDATQKFDQPAVGWINPSNNKCGAPGYTPMNLSFLLDQVQYSIDNFFNRAPRIVSTQCWSAYDANGVKDFNDFVLVWTNTSSLETFSPRPTTTAYPTSTAYPTATAYPTSTAIPFQ